MNTNKRNILIVEDEMLIAFELKLFLEDKGYEVVDVVMTAEKALQAAFKYHPEIIMMDIKLKGINSGLDISKEIRKIYNPFIIFTTGNFNEETLEGIKTVDNSCCLIKPVNEFELEDIIEKNSVGIPPARGGVPIMHNHC